MANLSTLPKEILHEIISYVSPEHGLPAYAELLNCSVVCKSVSEVANAALYYCIDLTIEENFDKIANEKTDRRQRRLLLTLTENPHLGAMVRVFKNNKTQKYTEHADMTMRSDTDTNLLHIAARNMKRLSKAFLMPSELTANIIVNLPDYTQLVNLSIHGFNPEEHMWRMAPVALKNLRWIFPLGERKRAGRVLTAWDNASILIDIVEATCPSLESLDMSHSEVWVKSFEQIPPSSPELTHHYAQVERSGLGNLEHLKSFAFRYLFDPDGKQTEIENCFVEFIQRYAHSLTSVTIPVPYGGWTREILDHILKVCMLLPGLKCLQLANTNCSDPGTLISALDFLDELTTHLSSPRYMIERFSISDIQCSFSPTVGTMFQSWTNLKYLQIGDGDMNDSPFGNDGRPQFDDYKPEILGFIKTLPRSLEKLMLEINGPDLCCDDDEDFDPIAQMGSEIFSTLRRLCSCDIHAWISNLDGGLGRIPEKAVMHRRLPSPSDNKQNSDIWKKVIWTSRLDCVYQGENESVKVDKVLLELKSDGEPFEGPDADGIWLDGYEFEVKRLPTGRGRPPGGPDYSWPFFVNHLAQGGFRDKYS